MMSPKANAISPSKPKALSTPTHMLKPADTVVESKKNPPNIESLKVSFSSLFSCFYYEAELQLVLLHA